MVLILPLVVKAAYPRPKEFYVLEHIGSDVVYDNEKNLPPIPPPGFVYEWQYAGYRNADGTITEGKCGVTFAAPWSTMSLQSLSHRPTRPGKSCAVVERSAANTAASGK